MSSYSLAVAAFESIAAATVASAAQAVDLVAGTNSIDCPRNVGRLQVAAVAASTAPANAVPAAAAAPP